jgi:hypothetical protein
MPSGFAIDPILAIVNGITIAVLLWNVFLAGQIAQLRAAPPVFRGVTALVGLLLAPALFVHVLGANILTGRAIASVQWIWPAVLLLFVIQAAYATVSRLVTSLIALPILAYNTFVFGAALVRWAEAQGFAVPTWAWALPAAEAAMLGIASGGAALTSSLALAMPILSPAYPARWRLSKTVRVTLALYAAAASAVLALETVRGARTVTSYAAYDDEPLRERAPSDFAIGLRVLPALDGAPPNMALRHDLALADSAGVRTLLVRLTPEGARFAALDSLARALEGRRSDSTVLVVALGYTQAEREARGRDAAEWRADRIADVDRIVRRLRPDILLPADDPYGAGQHVLGRVSPREWAEWITAAAARAKRLRPRTRIAVSAARFDAADSLLFAWAASPGSPIDVLGLTLQPSFAGAVSLDARLRAADRWLRTAPAGKPVWVFAAGGYPSTHGQRSQARAIWGTLVWASARERVKGVVVADAGDYETLTGLRAPGGRVRPAAAVLSRAIRSLREIEGQ